MSPAGMPMPVTLLGSSYVTFIIFGNMIDIKSSSILHSEALSPERQAHEHEAVLVTAINGTIFAADMLFAPEKAELRSETKALVLILTKGCAGQSHVVHDAWGQSFFGEVVGRAAGLTVRVLKPGHSDSHVRVVVVRIDRDLNIGDGLENSHEQAHGVLRPRRG